MPPQRKKPLCEIIFRQMRIPVSDKEKGKQVIEGIFMIGEIGKSEAKPRARKRGRRKAKTAKAVVRVKRAGRGKRMKRGAKRQRKKMPGEIGVSPMTVG